jgi:predicted amidohydrolase
MKATLMSQNDTLTLAALQINPAPNPTDTFLQTKQLLDTLQSQIDSIDCVVLPEYAFGTFREWATSKKESDEMTNQIQESLSSLAKEYQVPLIGGSIPIQTEKNQWRNRSYAFSPTGKNLGTYDKHHPFRAERLLGLEPGTETPIFRFRNLRMATLICSDLWFHDLVSQVATKVDFLAVPTMTTVLDSDHIRYGQWTWQSLVAVRAKEYTIPIVSADQASREYAPGVFTCGGTCIADPSYRFREVEGPSTQALKVASTRSTTVVTSIISLKAIQKYTAYRREVGLRSEE